MSGTRERTFKGHTEHYRKEGLGRFRNGERQDKDRSARQTDGTLNRDRDKDKSDVGLRRGILILGVRRRHKTFDGESRQRGGKPPYVQRGGQHSCWAVIQSSLHELPFSIDSTATPQLSSWWYVIHHQSSSQSTWHGTHNNTTTQRQHNTARQRHDVDQQPRQHDDATQRLVSRVP